jgi:hypothetical protein
MAKLRKLMTESKYLKREFGEPLPTFKGVMKQHQVNKLQEDWWDMLEPDEQAAYIKAHPGSEKAQGAKDEPEKITKGPGGYGDRGNVRGQDQAYSGEPDDEEYFKSMMSRTGKELEENWWDDMSDAAQAAYIKKHGEAPNVSGGDDEGGGDDKGGGDNSERLEQIAQEKAALEQEMEDAEARGDKAAYADADEKLYELEQEEEKLGGGGEPDEIDLGKPYPDGNAPPKTSMIDNFSSQKWLDHGLEEQKQYQAHLEKWAEEAADNDDDETLAKIEELMAECKKEQERLEKDGAKGMYRTGNELNQETLTIDGKQFRRISEGVEKESKPKYEFSEFYQRFKK